MRISGRRLRRLALRTINQVAMSVLATLAASAIYSTLRHGNHAPGRPAPDASTGFRASGVVTDSASARLPLVATWGPPAEATILFKDPDWPDPTADTPPRVVRSVAVSRHPTPDPAVPAPGKPIPIARLDLRPPPAVVVTDKANPLWSGASSAVSSATAAVGTATSTATSAVRGAVAFGGAIVAHVMP